MNEFTGLMLAEQQPALVFCPHCGHGETRINDSVYVVHALSAEEEAYFNMVNPLDIEDSTERPV